MREVEIDRAVYLVDDETGTYRFLRRHPSHRGLTRELNERDRQALAGYARHHRAAARQTFRTANAVRGKR